MNLLVPSSDFADLLAHSDDTQITNILCKSAPADAAEALLALPTAEQVRVLRILPTSDAARLFEYWPTEAQARVLHALEKLDHRTTGILLDAMAQDARTALLEKLPPQVCARLVDFLSPAERNAALKLLAYPLDSVGRLMTGDFLTVLDHWNAADVLRHIRNHGHGIETVHVMFVIDEEGRLLDDLRIHDVLLSPLDRTVHEIRNGSLTSLQTTDDQEAAVLTFQKYDRTVLPVVDGEGMLAGIVTVDDIMDVAEEEATEDIHKLGGVEQLDDPYLEMPIFRLIRKRASWLVVLFLGEMLTATAMAYFEGEIVKAVVLATFVPLIISSGGNSGSQAATLIIRAMALGELQLRDWWRVIRREMISGLVLGLILCAVGMMRITAWAMFTDIYGEHWFLIALTVGFSLIGVVLWGTISGSMLPFLLRRLGLDPATSSAPFVATLVDVTGLVIYFVIAGYVLRGTLL